MAIGSAAGGVDISKNARTLFGSADDLFGGAGTSSIFAGGGSNSGEAVRASLKGLERELNRLLGFKSDFTPAQQKRLDVLQAEIGEIESKGKEKGLDANDAKRRAERYQEAYAIMGKDYVDVGSSEELQALSDKVDKLLEPKLQGAKKARLERLQKLEESYLDALVRNPKNETARRQLRNAKVQIGRLLPARSISELSVSERREYDGLVEQINDLAGTEFLLGSKKRMRADKIRASMSELQAQASALGIGQSGPSAAEVARAYTRF
ncbi:MAG TPA: hypothetical protein PK405_08380 [Hyphomicrobiales bacterium]|nr:hypothetical protein [Rhodobiaceae bacterium]HXK54686.1 hypothetical protein [Hyphomicrobiales bacterium]